MSKPKPINPRRGEVWDVILVSYTDNDPQKSQSAVVINTDGLNSLAPRLVIPITTWNDDFSGAIWIVQIKPYKNNGLKMPSAANITESQWVDVKNFICQRGTLNARLTEDIAAAIAAIIEYK